MSFMVYLCVCVCVCMSVCRVVYIYRALYVCMLWIFTRASLAQIPADLEKLASQNSSKVAMLLIILWNNSQHCISML